ncbi:Hyphancin-3F [Papilio xuthus]|uniref:Hyphancin-3F n=1 Tax=Papilio xuthus TaxID=66420 RepID=I4DLJ0_PAPXU|nr:Hyphancin-3F [Papilio xuthus]BAM18780.1 unknown secreted protein [Papilio xuthus]
MNFNKILSFAFVLFAALSSVIAAPEPRWNPFKKLERVGQNIRDGIIKAGPAVAVVGQAASIIKPGK